MPDTPPRAHDLETLLAHAGCTGSAASRDLVDPIHLSTTYARDESGGFSSGYKYTRTNNPTRQSLEQILCQLEGGNAAVAFSSGMAAATAIFATLPANSRVLYPHDVYSGVRDLLLNFAPNWGIEAIAVDMANLDEVRGSMDAATKLIWIETPSNPLLKITDVRAVCDIATQHNVEVAVDGTWTTPLIQRPLDLGAAYVVHSVTKYLSGHSDVLGGVVVGRNDSKIDSVREFQKTAGSVLDPFSAWLTTRGLRTLSVRLDRQCTSALTIANWLDKQPIVKTVRYPGLPTHPGHGIATSQMSLFGAMLSFELDCAGQEALAIAGRTSVFSQATSLGGTESLIEHRRSAEGPNTTTPDNLIRLSIGLESVDDLLADLEYAFSSNRR